MGNPLKTIKTMLLCRIRRNRPAAGSGAEWPKDSLKAKTQPPHSRRIVIKMSAISDSRCRTSKEWPTDMSDEQARLEGGLEVSNGPNSSKGLI